MTGSDRPGQQPRAVPAAEPGVARLRAWRREMEAQQQRALPAGPADVTCSAPPGTGGLGRHVEEILDALRRRGPGDGVAGRMAGEPAVRWAGAVPLPLPLGLRALTFAAEFDLRAARALPPAESLVAFNGQSLAQQRAMRRRHPSGATVALVSANSHMRRVIRQHERALKRYPLEQSWTRWMLRRNLREYSGADEIQFASEYIRESLVEEGVPESRLRWFPLTPHPRFDAVAGTEPSDAFEIVYSGSLAVHKGVPLLIDAFRRLAHDDMRLVLVGGWGTRGMRRFVQAACAADSRISAAPGDPLGVLRRASLCVHAAYEDGFAYAPAEAYVAGVPVIVSEDTGMKDMIDSEQRGLVLPTGDGDALSAAIEAAYRGEILRG